ncbi:putative V-type proton ATPase subunit d [Salvia divinorum]|uniref:V-type proton ATPase subunit d n=1 Tax=Salvia divinorum TaxID=28513 RepID=A0ABD1GYB5_SALDI
MVTQATEPRTSYSKAYTKTTTIGRFEFCHFSNEQYGHMIDNVVLIVTGTLHERDVQKCWRNVILWECLTGLR